MEAPFWFNQTYSWPKQTAVIFYIKLHLKHTIVTWREELSFLLDDKMIALSVDTMITLFVTLRVTMTS